MKRSQPSGESFRRRSRALPGGADGAQTDRTEHCLLSVAGAYKTAKIKAVTGTGPLSVGVTSVGFQYSNTVIHHLFTPNKSNIAQCATLLVCSV